MLYSKVIIVYSILYCGFRHFGPIVKEGKRDGNCDSIVEGSAEEPIFATIDFSCVLIVYG